MIYRMTRPLSSAPDKPRSRAPAVPVGRTHAPRPESTATPQDDPQDLAAAETALRAAMAALSPDPEALQRDLVRAQTEREAPSRHLSFQLVVIVAVLVFLILTLDLLLTAP
jgi:hypothetical protein